MDEHEIARDAAEDVGYANAIKDIMSFHLLKISEATDKAKKSFIDGVHIGADWNGKHLDAAQLMQIAIFHTECMRDIKKQFGKYTK